MKDDFQVEIMRDYQYSFPTECKNKPRKQKENYLGMYFLVNKRTIKGIYFI